MFLSEVLNGILLTAGGAAGGKWGSEEDFSSQKSGGEGTGEERREKSLRHCPGVCPPPEPSC